MSYHRTPKSAYYVYFARSGDMMKIGCSIQPVERLKQIAEWVPFKTKLVATQPGAFDLESDLHAYFADSWSHLEWFHVTEKMEAYVSQILLGKTPDFPKLPRNHGKELAKTLKKRASRRVSMAEKAAGLSGDYWKTYNKRPMYLRAALASFSGSHNPPPSASALEAIGRYERELASRLDRAA